VPSSCRIITTNKPTTNFFTGRMPFLSPNQGVSEHWSDKTYILLPHGEESALARKRSSTFQRFAVVHGESIQLKHLGRISFPLSVAAHRERVLWYLHKYILIVYSLQHKRDYSKPPYGLWHYMLLRVISLNLGYWHQRADETHGNPPLVLLGAISGQTKLKDPRWAWGMQVHGMWHFPFQCFDTVGWATGRASGL